MWNANDSCGRHLRGTRRPVSTPRVLGALALLACGPLATGQAAQAVWTAEQLLNSPAANGSLFARPAVNAAGVAAVVWDERVDYSTTHVYVSVDTGAGWSTPRRLTITPTSYNAPAGAEVAADGTITAYWVEAGVANVATLRGGTWSSASPVPADPGYSDLAGAGIDRDGNLQVLMAAPRLNGTLRSYDFEVLVRDALGSWSVPLQLTQTPGAWPRLLMNSSGQALVIAGYKAWRSDATGIWPAVAQTIPSLAGQTYVTDAAIDAAGNGYFVLYNRYGGMNISTSTPGSSWKPLRRLSKFEVLGSSLAITGGGPGGALIHGVDWSTGKLRASTSTTAGRSWGALASLGTIDTQAQAAGSATGLYAIAWDGKVSAGTGVGTKAAAWNTQTLSPFPYLGSVALADGRAVAAWVRGASADIVDMVVSANRGDLLR